MKKIILMATALAACMSLKAQSVYQKVTTAPDDWTGTYLIVCESQSVAFNGAADEDNIDAKGTGTAIVPDITIVNNTITGNSSLDSATFTISATEDDDWPWAIQSASGLYIGHKDSIVGDNGLSVETKLKNRCKHVLEIDANGNFIATPRHIEGVAYNLQYNKKADQLRFRYYLPEDKQAIQIYKLISEHTDSKTVKITGISSPKYYRNGRMVIISNGRKYTLLGTSL